MQDDLMINTMRDYLKIMFRHKIIFVVLPVAILIPVYFTLQLVTPMYKANVKLFVKAQKQTEAEYYKGIYSSSITGDHTELVTSNIVLARVVEALKLYETPIDQEKNYASSFKAALIEKRSKKSKKRFEQMTSEEKKKTFSASAMQSLKNNISVLPVRDTSFFVITVVDFDPKLVPFIVNSLSRSYVIFDLEQQIQEYKLKYGEKHSTVLQLQKYIEELEGTLHGKLIPDIDALGPATIKIIEQAQNAHREKGLNSTLLLLVAFIAGIFFSAFFAVLLEYLDQNLKSPYDIETVLNVPCLGSIPKKRSKDDLLIDLNTSGSKYMQALEDLSNQIYSLAKETNNKSILISDVEGTSESIAVIANIAMYLSNNAGHRILIIDANMRKPSISELLNIPNDRGLSNVLAKEISLEAATQSIGPVLNVLSSGTVIDNPIALLNSSDMSDLINETKKLYDLIIIKCVDIRSYPDLVVLSSVVDGIVLMVNEGKVRRQVLSRALVPLQQNKSKLMGVVFNNCEHVIPDFIYKIM